MNNDEYDITAIPMRYLTYRLLPTLDSCPKPFRSFQLRRAHNTTFVGHASGGETPGYRLLVQSYLR